MDFLDKLNARIERNRASDREVAKAVGTTVAAMDRDTTAPDPGHIGTVVGRMRRRQRESTPAIMVTERTLTHVYGVSEDGRQWFRTIDDDVWFERKV